MNSVFGDFIPVLILLKLLLFYILWMKNNIIMFVRILFFTYVGGGVLRRLTALLVRWNNELPFNNPSLDQSFSECLYTVLGKTWWRIFFWCVSCVLMESFWKFDVQTNVFQTFANSLTTIFSSLWVGTYIVIFYVLVITIIQQVSRFEF